MKKIIYIDLYSSNGHANFNKIYINGLIEAGGDVRLVIKENYILDLELPHSLLELSIPKHFYKVVKGGLRNRLQLFTILQFIKSKIKFSKYDLIIFAGYEEVSLFFSNIRQRLILINHNNISGLNNEIKRFFFKQISRNSTHVVFEEYIKERLQNIGIKNILVIPHGIPIPYTFNSKKDEIYCNSIISNNRFQQFEYIIFSPSSSSVDAPFIELLIKYKKFITFLKERKILLIIKGNFISLGSENIFVINKYLTDVQYKSLFTQSHAILISYPISHKYRVSAVFFECVANNKPCFLSNIEALKTYKSFIKYNPFFSNPEELIERINDLFDLDNKILSMPYINTDKLNPTFNLLIK